MEDTDSTNTGMGEYIDADQNQEFIEWLTKTNLLMYLPALVDEGYDDLVGKLHYKYVWKVDYMP
jgi:hypothetical protein